MNIRKIIEEELSNILKEEESPFARIARLADPDPSPFEKIARAADPNLPPINPFTGQTPSFAGQTPEQQEIGRVINNPQALKALQAKASRGDSLTPLEQKILQKAFRFTAITMPEESPEAGGSAPAPTAARPRPRPRPEVKRVQQLINKVAAKLTWLPPLEPTKGSKEGEDGIYGKDTRIKLSAIFKNNLKNMSMAEIEASLQKLLDAYSRGSAEPKEGEVIPSGTKTASPTEPVPSTAAPIEMPPVEADALARIKESKSLRGMILKEILAALK